MKTTHTHRGHCQACGAIQAIDNTTGLLAKHGYRVAGFGYFMGVCPGAGHQSLEKERAYTDFIIADMRRLAAEYAQHALDLTAGKIHPDTVDTGVRDDSNPNVPIWKRPTIRVPFAQGTEYQQKRAVELAVSAAERESRAHNVHGDMLAKLAADIYGKDTLPVKTKEPPARIYDGLKFNGGAKA